LCFADGELEREVSPIGRVALKTNKKNNKKEAKRQD